MLRLATVVVATLIPFASAQGAINLQITEIFTGLDGEDGTLDWFEVTNLGDTTADTGDYLFDDGTPAVGSSGILDSFTLGQGESAVFLISNDNVPVDNVTYATALEEFTGIWGGGINVGLTNGGGNLGQSGDTVNIGTDNGGVFDILDTESFLDTQAGLFPTVEIVNDAVGLSVLGQRNAYESNPFFNDNIGPAPDFMITLIGSPGAVPEPCTLILFGLSGLVIARRRRAHKAVDR